MPETFKTLYGLDWDPHVPDYQVELAMARFHRLERFQSPDSLRPGEHFLRAVRMLLTPEQFKINEWFELIAHGFCEEEEMALIGCASANKSHSCGLIAILDWMTSPHDTTTFFCSTDKAALEKRSWASVIMFYSLLRKKGLPAVYSASRMAVLNKDDGGKLKDAGIDTPEEIKSGLYAVAAMASQSESRATSKFIGVHQPTETGGVRMFADEAQAVRQSFLDARTNLMIGTDDFRLVALGNPMERRDPLGRLSEPARGWTSVSLDESESWRNKTGGLVIRFDGFRSPALKDPRSFPFLINQKHIDRVKKRVRGDETHRDWLTMVRGWPGDDGDVLSVFASATQKRLRISKVPEVSPFVSAPLRLAGLDPAFSVGGDDAALVTASLGVCADGVRRLVFDQDVFYVSVDASRTDESSALDQRVESVLTYLEVRRIPLWNLGVDESGVQTMGAVLMMKNRMHTPGPPHMVIFSQRASEYPVSADDPTLVRDRIYDSASEGWALAETYARYDQLRGVPVDVAGQWAARRWMKGRFPKRLESKEDYRKRESRSPDAGDAAAVLLLLARHRFNFIPGGDHAEARGGALGSLDPFGGAAVISEMAEEEEDLYEIF